jgi:hypothetical protein
MDQRKLLPGLMYHFLLVLHQLRAWPKIPFTQDEALLRGHRGTVNLARVMPVSYPFWQYASIPNLVVVTVVTVVISTPSSQVISSLQQ